MQRAPVMHIPGPSPGPQWEALQEPEPSSDDELDTDGEVDALGSAKADLYTQRTRDGCTEAPRDPPSPALASTSTDNSRPQMKRKESESLFMSKKRARLIDQDDLDEHENKIINGKSAEKKKQSGVSVSVPSPTMIRKLGNSSTSPSTLTNTKTKDSPMKPLPFLLPNRPSEVAESSRPATLDLPSKLAGLPFDSYKRAERTSPMAKGKVPINGRRVPSASQTTRHPSTSKTKAIAPDVEIIEVSEDDSPSPSISKTESKSKSKLSDFKTPEQARSRAAKVESAPGTTATKKFLPRAPIEVIEILDSDDELPSKAQEKRSSGSRLSELVQECATGSNPRQPPSNFESSDRDADKMDVDEEYNQPASALSAVGSAHLTGSDSSDLADIPSSSRVSSQELEVTDDTNDSQAAQGLISLPSSSPSSIGLSPKDRYLSTPPPPTTSITSLTSSPPPRQPSTPTMIVRNTASTSNRLGFTSVAASSSLQAPPPADKHLKQCARKAASMKGNKGKEKEIPQTSFSASGSDMPGFRDGLTMDSDKLKQQSVLPTWPKKERQTLAEAIISAGQLNRIKKKVVRRPQGNTKDVPIDLTSETEGGVMDGPMADEKTLKAAIGSSRRLVDLLKEKNSISVAAKVTESPAPSPQGKRPPSTPPRTQDFHAAVEPPESPSIKTAEHQLTLSPRRNIMAHDMLSQSSSPPPPVEMRLKSESSVRKTSSGTAAIGSPKRLPLPKRPSVATIEKMLAASSDGIATPTTGIIGVSGEAGKGEEDVSMADVPSAAPVMSPSSIPLPLSPPHSALMNSPASMQAKPFTRLTLPKRSPLAMSETSFVASTVPDDRDSSLSSVQTRSTTTAGRPSDDVSMTVISARKSHSPKLAGVKATLLGSSIGVRTQSPGKRVSLQPTAPNDSITRDTVFEAPKTPLSIHSQRSSIVSASSSGAQDRLFDTLPLDSPDDDEAECQALLQGPDPGDVIPSHDVQLGLQDNSLVRYKPRINLDTSVASSSSASTTPEVFREHTPPIPQVPLRRSSRRLSSKSSHSSSSEGLGIAAFDDDSEPYDSVPATRTPTPEDEEPVPLSSPPKTYGGFRALTWKDYRKDLNNFTPKCYYAKDLPHALQDHINSMSEYTQNMEGMRDLFKATMLENTVLDEPDAPPIEVWNNVDNQSTPPWEFYYTNHMWLGEGVPPPDIKNLVSCSCKGGCNPRSKTCACLLRQREAAGDPQLEFVYDKNGRLKAPGYPIFECNDLCGCGDECRNRVVQHGRKVSVNIAKTETKGWGGFAGSKKIPGGTYLGIYSGELLTDAEAHERGIKYNKSGRTYLFDLDFHHLKDGNPDWQTSFTVDAYHAGNFTRFLNHSCDPNCRLYACYINEGNIQKPLLAIFTRRDIEPYEEICLNYQGCYNDDDQDSDDEDDDKVDPDHGNDMIYVPCRCGASNCTGIMFK